MNYSSASDTMLEHRYGAFWQSKEKREDAKRLRVGRKRLPFEKGFRVRKLMPGYLLKRAAHAIQGRTSERDIRRHLREKEAELYGSIGDAVVEDMFG